MSHGDDSNWLAELLLDSQQKVLEPKNVHSCFKSLFVLACEITLKAPKIFSVSLNYFYAFIFSLLLIIFQFAAVIRWCL